MIVDLLGVDAVGQLRRSHHKSASLLSKTAVVRGLPSISDIEYRLDRGTLHPFVKLISSEDSIVFGQFASADDFASGRPISGELIASAIMRGYSLLMWNYGLYDYVSYSLARSLTADFPGRAHANLYLSPPYAQGLPPHKDPHDVLVIQLEGTKVWCVEDLAGGRPFRLEKNGFLYLAKGRVHEAWSESEPSLHIALGFGYGSPTEHREPQPDTDLLEIDQTAMPTADLLQAARTFASLQGRRSISASESEGLRYLTCRERIGELLRASPLALCEVQAFRNGRNEPLAPYATTVTDDGGHKHAVLLFRDLSRLFASEEVRLDVKDAQRRLRSLAVFCSELERIVQRSVRARLSWVPFGYVVPGVGVKSAPFADSLGASAMPTVRAHVEGVFPKGAGVPGEIVLRVDCDLKPQTPNSSVPLSACSLAARLSYGGTGPNDPLRWFSRPAVTSVRDGGRKCVDLSLACGRHRLFPASFTSMIEDLAAQDTIRMQEDSRNTGRRNALIRYLIREGFLCRGEFAQ